MGQGIGGAVQLKFAMEKYRLDRNRKHFSQSYFDFYDCAQDGPNCIFTIKPEMFLPHYGSLLTEFYDIIGEDFAKRTRLDPDSELLKITDLDGFVASFKDRNGMVPLISSYAMTSILACDTYSSWIFYSGSRKAYLEEYATFTHFERILARFMHNPLAAIIKFGECS